MGKKSAGLLMYRFRDGEPQVLLVHPGGPFWAKKDWGSWSIPKGEYAEADDPFEAARREFREETGIAPSGDPGPYLRLTPRKQAGGKVVSCWAFEGDLDAAAIISNTFEMEWPPRSGKQASFPEVDRAEWFPLGIASRKILPGQSGFIDELRRFVT